MKGNTVSERLESATAELQISDYNQGEAMRWLGPMPHSFQQPSNHATAIGECSKRGENFYSGCLFHKFQQRNFV